ncbi:MAG: isopeptide-forming domain-containing fimbrial protein [Anaerovoracaceae bacterium]|jgi:fimbrial isopeptide formation D2 family protein
MNATIWNGNTRKKFFLRLLLAALLPLLLIWTASAGTTLPTEPVRQGGSGEAAFRSAGGEYSGWLTGGGFKVAAQYGFYPTATSETKITPFGKQDRDAFTFIDTVYGSGAKMPDRSRYLAFNLRRAAKGSVGWQGTNYRIYNTKTGQYDMIDVKITLSDWKAVDDPAYAFLECSGSLKPNFNIWGTLEVKMRVDYTRAGTEEPYEASGNFTFNDVDAQQYVGFEAAKTVKQYVTASSRLCYGRSGGYHVFHYTNEDEDDTNSPDYAVGATFKASSMTYLFGSSHLNDADRVTTWAHFGYYANTMAPVEPPVPVKTISDSDERQVRENTLQQRDELYTYHVRQNVPSGYSEASYFTDFRLEDELDPCLEPVAVRVSGEDGEDLSAGFDITVEDQRVVARARNTETSAFYGRLYSLDIDAKIRDGYDLKEYIGDDAAEIENTAYSVINNMRHSSNAVRTRYVPPQLQIDKEVDHYQWKVGEDAVYTILVRQTAENATAHDVVIQDISLPDYLVCDEETIRVEGIEEYKLTNVDNGWVLKVPQLSRGEEVRVTFAARIGAEAADRDTPNTASAEAADVDKVTDDAVMTAVQTSDPGGPGEKDDREKKDGKATGTKAAAYKTAAAGSAPRTSDSFPLSYLLLLLTAGGITAVFTVLRARR